MATVLSKYWRSLMVPIPLGNPVSIQPVLHLGTSAAVGGTLTLPTATNDIFKIITLPERVTIGANWALIAGDHDTGANLVMTLRIYDGTTPKTIIDATTVGQAGGIIRPTKIPTTENAIGFTTNSKLWWLEILIATGAAGGAQAAQLMVQLDLCGWYSTGAVTE